MPELSPSSFFRTIAVIGYLLPDQWLRCHRRSLDMAMSSSSLEYNSRSVGCRCTENGMPCYLCDPINGFPVIAARHGDEQFIPRVQQPICWMQMHRELSALCADQMANQTVNNSTRLRDASFQRFFQRSWNSGAMFVNARVSFQ
ncbi:hypothetical protein CDAR_182361 [Caerostris darwini]|uniref:Uncharacterized protein n=1 Tax=Caerostris darwini TaxID=1538125 RepID=A0AAV4U5I4_9ARAC|nr:hypothetical protein CDAR_182361 [Caerostris darwini]